MFDSATIGARDENLDRARCLFFDHGHDLARATGLLGGAPSEARAVNCALQLEMSTEINRRNGAFSTLHPGSAEVETICLLTDLLAELLRDIEAAEQADNGHVGAVSVAA